MYGQARADPAGGQDGVLAETAPDWVDEPAVLDALTVNEYAVLAASPVTVVDVPLTVTGFAPLRRTV